MDFIFEPPDFSDIFSFLWEKVHRKILRENPGKILQNLYNQKSPTTFCRGTGPTCSNIAVKHVAVAPLFHVLEAQNAILAAVGVAFFGICVPDATFRRGNISTFHDATVAKDQKSPRTKREPKRKSRNCQNLGPFKR